MHLRLEVILFFVAGPSSLLAEFWRFPAGPCGGHVMDIIRMDDGTLMLGTFTTGVFRSRDNAESWEGVNNGLPLYDITCLTTDSKGRLYAAVGNRGVYVSSDQGDSWESLSSGIASDMIQTLYIDDDATIYVAPRGKGIHKSVDRGKTWQSMGLQFKIMQTIVKLADGQFFAGGNDGIYRLDSSDTWQYVSADIPKEQVHTIAFSITSGAIYAGTYGLGVLRSTDNGETWSYVNNGFANVGYGWIEKLVIDENDVIYASVSHWYFGGLYYSTDDGANWTEIDTGISHKEFQSLLVEEDDLFLGVVNYGLYHARWPFDEWEPKTNGFWFYKTNCLASDAKGNVYAGTGAGLFRSSDGGVTWIERNMGTNLLDIRAVDCLVDDRIIMGVFFEGTFFSDTAGNSWNLQRNGLSNLNLNCLAHNADTIFLGTNIGLYTFTAGGDKWQHPSFPLSSAKITALYVQDETIYAGSNTGKIVLSKDNGETWSDISAGVPVQAISSIHLQHDELFVAANTAGIFKSSDDGAVWTDCTFDLPTRLINVLRSWQNDLYAGTQRGVFRLAGERWIAVNDGLVDTNIHDLHIDADGYLLAATDIGVARSTKKITAVRNQQEMPVDHVRLHPCHPNPSNGSTIISFTLAGDSHIILAIYDIRGRLVSTLVDELLSAGDHRISWKAEHGASGVYIVKLKAGRLVRTEKMIVQK